MADLLPTSPTLDREPADDSRVLGVDSEDADEVLGALSAGTARALLDTLYEEPATPSALAEEVDTSLQNAQYHLGKLEDADLIEEQGTRYSAKGREMTVYGPAEGAVVLFAGSEETTSTLRSALSTLLGAAGVLAAASLLVQVTLGEGLAALLGRGGAGAGAGAGGAGGGGDLGAMTVQSAEAGGTAAGLPPGALFFAGGLLALGVLLAWQYARR